MRKALFVFFVGLLITMSSCRKDFQFENSTGDLKFSKDTVYLDTVFTNIGSSTYTLKVYNRSNKDISIPTVQLGKGLDSKYRMTVDGMSGNGKIFNNVELLAKDSLYIFIETTAGIADANPTDFLYTDQIQFDNGSNRQTVELVTLIQDAVFLYPQRDDQGVYETIPVGVDSNGEEVREKGFYLEGNELNMTNEKPYVIYGYAGVPAGATLNIAAGARLHFHDGSALIAFNGATVNINGTASTTPALENEVVFEGDRLEPDFSDVPGQWLTIWMTQGSHGTFNNLTIKNSVVGMLVSGNDATDYSLNLKNVQIYDSSNIGIYAQTGHIKGENVVINNAGQFGLACTYGGKYNFTHCTFNNNWPSSKQVAVYANDYYESGVAGVAVQYKPLEEATFNNSIIYGSNQVEMLLEKQNTDSSAVFNYRFNHCLIKLNNIANQFTNDSLYQFTTDIAHYDTCYIATNSSMFQPHFYNVNHNDLRIDEQSEAIGKADPLFLIPLDIINVPRTTNDLGAYQNVAMPATN